jgi:hypothetical protein
MKAASIAEIKKDLQLRSQKELVDLCLQMAKFKKDSKDLLTFLLFESQDEAAFVRNSKEEISAEFVGVRIQSSYWAKKTTRKLIRQVNYLARLSGKKETKADLLLHLCKEMVELREYLRYDYQYDQIFHRQKEALRKVLKYLHEDLQYDYNLELEKLPDYGF